jgi:hypothetical protein
MRRSCRFEKGVHFNVHDLTLLSVLLTLPAARGRMRPETERIQKPPVRPVGVQPPPGPTPFFSMLNRGDRTLVSAVEAVTEILAVPASIASGKTLSTGSRVARAKNLPTGANNETKVLNTAVLTKSCAKGNPACSLAARNTSS